jgi:hypothetical protein
MSIFYFLNLKIQKDIQGNPHPTRNELPSQQVVAMIFQHSEPILKKSI